MKNRIITTALCVTLMSVQSSRAEDKNSSAVTTKKETPVQAKAATPAPKTLSAADMDANIGTANKTVTVAKKDIPAQAKAALPLSASDVLGDSQVTIDANIGVVESFTVMGECEEGKTARASIEQKRDLATQEIQDESKKFEKAKADYIAKSTTMSDSAREKEEKKLMKMEREIKTLVAEKEEELKLDMQIATETLAQGLEAGVAKLAKNENLDIVFDKMTGRAIYVSDKFDFTTKAIKEVNKNYEVKLAQNKQAESATKVADNKAVAAPKPAKISA